MKPQIKNKVSYDLLLKSAALPPLAGLAAASAIGAVPLALAFSWRVGERAGQLLGLAVNTPEKPSIDSGTLRNMVFQSKLMSKQEDLRREKERLLAQHIQNVLDKEYGLNA